MLNRYQQALSKSPSSLTSSVPNDAEPKYSKEALQDVVVDVSTHYITRMERIGAEPYRNSYSKQLPDLGECACLDHAFDRNRNTRREVAASRVVETAKQQFPSTPETQPTLTYLSMGSGALLQDFVICAMLLLQGYSLHVRLIEPSCDQARFLNAYHQFCYLQYYASQMGLNFVVEYFPYVLDYIKFHADEKIQVAHAIDFDIFHNDIIAKSDMVLVHQMLEKNGFFYVTAGTDDYLFRQTAMHAYPLSDVSIGQEFMETSVRAAKHERELADVTSIRSPSIFKNILSYVGLFSLKDPRCPGQPARNSAEEKARISRLFD
jgi:hypothetical protein